MPKGSRSSSKTAAAKQAAEAAKVIRKATKQAGSAAAVRKIKGGPKNLPSNGVNPRDPFFVNY